MTLRGFRLRFFYIAFFRLSSERYKGRGLQIQDYSRPNAQYNYYDAPLQLLAVQDRQSLAQCIENPGAVDDVRQAMPIQIR